MFDKGSRLRRLPGDLEADIPDRTVIHLDRASPAQAADGMSVAIQGSIKPDSAVCLKFNVRRHFITGVRILIDGKKLVLGGDEIGVFRSSLLRALGLFCLIRDSVVSQTCATV